MDTSRPTRRQWSGWPARHPWLTTLALAVVALLVLVLLWDWNWFKGPLERQVEAGTGREFDIGGDLDVDLGWTPVVRGEDLSFGNADWSDEPTMAAARHAGIAIELLPLLRGQVRIPRIDLDHPVLRLETRPEGGGNWQFGDSDGDSDVEFRRLVVNRGQLRFLDAANDTDIKVGLHSAPATEGPSSLIAVDGAGRWEGSDFTAQGTAESPLGLADPDTPYRIDLRAQAGRTRAHATGTLLDPLRLADFDLQLELSGQNLEDLYPLLGLALPPTPPYSVEGRLTRDIEGPLTTWHYDGFSGQVGDSDLGGDVAITTGGERPMFRGDLHSDHLDFDDLAGFVGAAPDAGNGDTTNPELAAQAREEAVEATVLPDTPYKLEKLRSMDADVRLRAATIEAPSLPLNDMDAHLKLEGGLLRLDPLDFGVAGGNIRSTIRMDARQDTIATTADINARGLDISSLLPEVELAQNAVGKAAGDARLSGTGNSIAAILGSSDGEVVIGMGHGRISNLLMEMAGIDLAEIIKFKLTEDRMIPVRCAFGDFEVTRGVMNTRSFAFDTTDTILIGEGTIDLGEERLDLVIKPRPKDRSLLSLRSPLLVDGTFKQPDLRPDLGRVGLRAAIALTLGSIAPPAALLGTLELGPGEDAGCGGKYAE
ncbi:AsmA family protein [Novilysobacter spongiicola]|uniref:AsmA domain-containing protein n=1 Tax=Lysobacter spongiicola DSM 21749 TaxID=1122188 RepID=A0A1T4RDS7_9GAMM|nr:AsmA family protein [Lysobacter spongiicola]SKA13898.1 hypothetical protein SAMN02745674_02101 [Lysobacter spongiicola DSM 21749]